MKQHKAVCADSIAAARRNQYIQSKIKAHQDNVDKLTRLALQERNAVVMLQRELTNERKI